MFEIQLTNHSGLEIDEQKVYKLIEYTCRKHDTGKLYCSVTIVDDEMISRMNADFLGKKATTDVLSFDLTEPFEPVKTFEIAVNAQMAWRIAAENHSNPQAELMLYILHGLLHNIGFDDLTEQEFYKMHAAEDRILEKLGWGRVFGDTKFREKK